MSIITVFCQNCPEAVLPQLAKRESVAALVAAARPNTAQNSPRAAAGARAVNSRRPVVMPFISGADGDKDKDQTAPTTQRTGAAAAAGHAYEYGAYANKPGRVIQCVSPADIRTERWTYAWTDRQTDQLSNGDSRTHLKNHGY